MKLELATYPVQGMVFAEKTEYDDGLLRVNREEILDLLAGDSRMAGVEVHLAQPGDKTRIIHVLDMVEPRFKTEGGTIFPGFLGPPHTVGTGRTHRLAGAAVVATGEFHRGEGGLMVSREHLIEMSGPGAPYCLGSDTHNLVITSRAAPGVTNAEYDAAVRLAMLKVAARLAETTRGREPTALDTYELGPVPDTLPRVGYVYQLQSQGALLETFVYGSDAVHLVPTLMHPNEFLDGAVVSGNHSLQTIPTYVHCRNPVIAELYRRHGKDLCFAGVILTEGHWKTTFLKERSASFAAKLARLLRLDGVVLTQEGGGMSMVDQMLVCRECERQGIKTVLISYEIGGIEGNDDTPLLDSVPEADAIVSTGNREELVELPAVETVLGGEEIRDAHAFNASLDPWGPIRVTFCCLYSATNQAGATRLQARQY